VLGKLVADHLADLHVGLADEIVGCREPHDDGCFMPLKYDTRSVIVKGATPHPSPARSALQFEDRRAIAAKQSLFDHLVGAGEECRRHVDT
jgi:hypothetical protein